MTGLDSYYSQQAGSGVSIYHGVRYQRGHGFFGRFFKGSLLPLLQSVGHKLLSTGVDVADDVVNRSMDPMESLKMRGRVAAKDTVNDLITRARTKLSAVPQAGGGRRKSIKGVAKKKRRTIKKKTSVKKTSRKRTKKGKRKSAKKASKKRSKKPSKKTAKKRQTKRKKPVPGFLDY